MKIRLGLLALPLALSLSNGLAWADDDDRPQREDPWEYDDAKKKAREQEEEDEASEDAFANAGQLVLSAERLVGVSRTAIETKVGGVKHKDSVNRANLLLNQDGNVYGYSHPRVAFDYFVIDGLSLGGAVGFSVNSGDAANRELILAPRVGYAYMFSDTVGVWPRLGGTYQYQKTPEGVTGLLAISFEANLVIVPTEHVAFTIAPTIDASLVGKFNPVGPEKKSDYKQEEIGLQTGLSVFF
ncbi:MAG TPA: hypothetical protein VFQ35_28590 [Polyangiaceae bacterium]|nr:hypothetical protein [Polyangiaceae bacterium]